MKKVRVLEREFRISIPSVNIQARIQELADQISEDMRDLDPLFIGILNGSFIFASDLLRRMSIDVRITFLKLASYQGTSSTGQVKELIGLSQDIKGVHVVVLEDIVDTGKTLKSIIQQLESLHPASVRTITLLYKPASCMNEVRPDYIGFNIPADFIIGYGLDYNGYGRKYEDIYTLIK